MMQTFNEEMMEDGIELLREPPYELEYLRKFIADSCLSNLCSFLHETDDVVEICRNFLGLLRGKLTLDQITTIMVAASMTYYIDAQLSNRQCRMMLLQRAFAYTDTINPLHIHLAAKRVYEALKMDGTSHSFNIINIVNQIAIINETARAIAICLMWAILCEITDTEYRMYCFLKFSRLNEMLANIDDDCLRLEKSTRPIFILVQCIGFLINMVVFGSNDYLKENGYRSYFRYSLIDIKGLVRWAEHICNILKVSVWKTENYWDLRMSIREYVHSNISAVLQDKILEIQPVLSFKDEY